MNIGFDGKTVFVTGAAHGFGRGIAQAFAALGASVYASDVREDELAATQAESAGKLSVATVDVADPAAVRDWIESSARETGRVDVIVNNAGGVLGQVGHPIEDVSPEDWQAIFRVNLDSVYHTTRAAVAYMKRANAGRIINISSGAGLGVSLTGIQAYASAKAGQIGLTRQLAHELGPWNITVNAIAPGFVLSNPTTQKQWESYGPAGQQRLVQGIALKRLGQVSDIVNGVLFFASDHAGWITGQVLSIDGGK